MIVRTIQVANWRCLLEEVKVGPFSDGLNVIHAPNGTGKSSLFEALQRALLDGHRVTGRDVEGIRPWGRDLGPRVTVEFVHAGLEYRMTKQFLHNPIAVLERKEGGRYRRLAEGAAADQQAREILTKNPPGRGLSRLENWGLAQILWAPQGNLAIGPLSGDVAADLRSMLSAQISSAGTGTIEKRIEERYLQFFTAKGKLKTGKDAPRLTRLREELVEATQDRQKAFDQYTAFEDASRRVEELRAGRVQARRDAEEIMKALREARVAAERYRRLMAERDQRDERLRTAEAQYRELRERVDHIRAIDQELREAQKTLRTLESEVPLKEREVREVEQEAARRKADLEDARKGREAVDRALELAAAGRRFNDCRRELERIADLTGKISEAEGVLARCREKRNEHLAPDLRTLKMIRALIKARDEAQVRIEGSLITLEIVPQKDGSLEVVSGEKTGPVELMAGVPAQVKGSPQVVAELPHVGRLRAWGPVGSVEEHREARTRAEQELKKLSEPFGTSDPDVLEWLVEKGKELDAKVAESDTRLKTLLAGRTVDELMRERRVLESAYKGFLEVHPEWLETAPDVEALETRAEEMKQAFVARVERSEDAWERAQQALAAAAARKETLSRQVDDATRRISGLTKKLADLTRDGKSHEEREAELQRVTMAWEASKARLAEIEDQLGRYEDDPVAFVGRLEAQLEAADQVSNRAREQEVREEARLEGLCGQGPYSALAAAEEKLAKIKQEVEREELRVEAIRLLYDTVAACRAEAIATVSRPVEAVATRTLQRIAGRRLGRIQIGDAFEPAAVVPESAEQPVTLDHLSGGEQEQLYLATRLALAEILGREGRQMVVLDDVLTATDAGRLARVMNVLEEAAEQLQVLILTCHPERYGGLKHVCFFDLASLRMAPVE